MGMMKELFTDIELAAEASDEWLDNERLATDSTTGGRKGVKDAQLAPMDPRSLYALARVTGKGVAKYPDAEPGVPNWSRGYAWSLSYNAAMRHMLKWWAGESADPESGESHLAHAAWHMMALMSFERRGVGVDDRFKS